MMSLAHFEGCLNDVSADYAMDIATAIACVDKDKTTLSICRDYYYAKVNSDVDKMNECVNKLKEYYRNA